MDNIQPRDPEPGFALIDGDVNGTGYNETKVDVIFVPCPGADPVETWARDPLPDDIFPAVASPSNTPGITKKTVATDASSDPTRGGSGGGSSSHPVAVRNTWVQQGIRSSVSAARVLLYRHRQLTDDLDLDTLARDLLKQVWDVRDAQPRDRPLFFISHSIGGLVVKLALCLTDRDEMKHYRALWFHCHGVAFFGTPHRGSSYMAMPNLSGSIQQLLGLERPLPRPISSMLRLGRKPLQTLHDNFLHIASDQRIWTFYETIDSQLSGTSPPAGDAGFATDEVRFGAPLVSIKSGILGSRRDERVFSLESNHSNLASFGRNLRTLDAFLADLAASVLKAESLRANTVSQPLQMKKRTNVELIGFYEDPDYDGDGDAGTESAIRLYFGKFPLAQFLKKGPERCLEQRLNMLAGKAGGQKTTPRRLRRPEASRSAPEPGASGSGGLWTNVRNMLSPPRPDTEQQGQTRAQSDDAPGITVTAPPPHHPGRLDGTRSLPADPDKAQEDGEDLSPKTPAEAAEDSERISRKTVGDEQPQPGAAAATATDEEADLHGPARPSRRPPFLRRDHSLSDMAAGFSRPDKNKKKFTWIHVPFTNPAWVQEIFAKLSETHGSFSKVLNSENWGSKHVSGRHSQAQPNFVKPACNLVLADTYPLSIRTSSEGGGGGGGGGRDAPQAPSPSPSPSARGLSPEALYLYLPYLHFDTYVNMIRRRRLILRRTSHGRCRPTPKDVAEMSSLELRALWAFLGYDPPLNGRRTLDQFGHPSLRDTFARDDDQMLYKLTKKDGHDDGHPHPADGGKGGWSYRMMMAAALDKGEEEDSNERVDSTDTAVSEQADGKGQEPKKRVGEKKEEDKHNQKRDIFVPDVEISDSDIKDGNVLMVDQLWLWAIDKTTLTTFFPKRESRPTEGTLFQQADLRNSVYNELNGDLTGRTENALDLAAFIVLHAVTVLLDRSSHPDLEVFRIFDEAIGMLTERMTSSLKQFRMQTFRQVGGGDDGDAAEDNRSRNIKKRHRQEIEKAERTNRENTSALMELRDLEDELSTLLRLFDTQSTVIDRMATLYDGEALRQHTTNGRQYLVEALARLEEYKGQTNDMLKRVDTTRKDFEKLLEMAQRQAQVDDVRWSRLQWELASSSNLSVMILTIFSVLFLPLTFLTGVWGMNTAEWTSGSPLDLRTIGAVSLPLSALLIVSSLAAAFSSRLQHASGAAWQALRSVVATTTTGQRQGQGQGPGPGGAGGAGGSDSGSRAGPSKRELERNYDFWADLRRRRGSMYQIPEVNRVVPGAATAPGGGGGGGGGRGDAAPGIPRSSTWKAKVSSTF